MASNAQLGKIILISAIAVFFYYFFWVAVLPFMLIDEGEFSTASVIHPLIHKFY